MAHHRQSNQSSVAGNVVNSLNPFYIEPSKRGQWDGDWQYDDDLQNDAGVNDNDDLYDGAAGDSLDGDYFDDEEEEEEEGLLLTRIGGGGETNSSIGSRSNYSDDHYRGRRRRTALANIPRRQSSSFISPKLCIAVSVVFMFFFVVLSLSSGGGHKSHKNQDDKGAGSNENNNNVVDPSSTNIPVNQDTNSNGVIDGSSSGGGTNDNIDENDNGEESIQVIVLGERHSGLETLVKQISLCFSPTASVVNQNTGSSFNNDEEEIIQSPSDTMKKRVDIRSGYVRPGFWFQYNPPLHQSNKEWPEPLAKNSTIVVYSVRHPIPWVESMRLQPDKMPNHYNRSSNEPLPWEEFLLKPLTMERPPQDSAKRPSETCQLQFAYSEVLPCHVVDSDLNILTNASTSNTYSTESEAVYELYKEDGSGKPYDNLLQLRAAKIKHIIEDLPNDSNEWLKQVLIRKQVAAESSGSGDDNGSNNAEEKTALFIVRYENKRSVWNTVRKIEQVTGWDNNCKNADDVLGLQQQEKTAKLGIPKEYAQAISQLVDWDTEALIGYTNDTLW